MTCGLVAAGRAETPRATTATRRDCRHDRLFGDPAPYFHPLKRVGENATGTTLTTRAELTDVLGGLFGIDLTAIDTGT